MNLYLHWRKKNIINYCYNFIGLKVYGKTRLPESNTHIPDERKEVIAELFKEIEGIHNIAKIRFILNIVRNYKKGGVEV